MLSFTPFYLQFIRNFKLATKTLLRWTECVIVAHIVMIGQLSCCWDMAVYRLSVDPSLSCLITPSLFSLRLKFICFTNPSQLRLPHIGLLLKISPTVGLHEAATRTKSRVTRKSAVTATYILIHKIHAPSIFQSRRASPHFGRYSYLVSLGKVCHYGLRLGLELPGSTGFAFRSFPLRFHAVNSAGRPSAF